MKRKTLKEQLAAASKMLFEDAPRPVKKKSTDTKKVSPSKRSKS